MRAFAYDVARGIAVGVAVGSFFFGARCLLDYRRDKMRELASRRVVE
jgi:hypothetical protein